MRAPSLVVCILLAAFTAASITAAPPADLLTAADVEKASGLTELRKVPKDQSKGAGGDLNFAGKDGKLVAIVMISTSMFDFWKKQYAKSCEPVSGVWAEAFRTKAGAFPSYLIFRKGSTGVWIQSMGWKKDGSSTLSPAQLADLARVAASRL